MLTLHTERDYEVIKYINKFYMRTRDLANILYVKNPMEFTKNIKREFGKDSVILKGKRTEKFRKEDDTARTTFVEVKDALLFLECGKISHKMNVEKKQYLIKCLKTLL